MTESALQSVIQKIYDFSGLKIVSPQIEGLKNLIRELSSKQGISPEEYCNCINSSHPDFPLIINQVTVNETYFFREEKQFDILKNNIFPKFAGKKMNIWSGACSTGEEPISLLAMALSCNVDVTVFASDIDDNALNKIKDGIYSKFSFRTDGSKYHELLRPYYTENNDKYVFKKDFIARINLYRYNLTEDTRFPFSESLDLIFLRNVFIYFNQDIRKKISKNISYKLNDGGALFYSMNEIGSLDDRIIPSSLYKTNIGSVYYFLKGRKPEEDKKILHQEKQKNLDELFDKIKKLNSLTKTAEQKIPEKKAEQKSEIINEPDIQEYFEKVCHEINSGNFENARKLTQNITSAKNKVFFYFLQGYTEYYADNKENAEKLFSTAELLKKDFWPAYFYHGLVLKDIGKKEKSNFCFEKCTALLDYFGADNPYNFILDSFSPSYIYSLCRTMIQS